jgi:hypothetical protein
MVDDEVEDLWRETTLIMEEPLDVDFGVATDSVHGSELDCH